MNDYMLSTKVSPDEALELQKAGFSIADDLKPSPMSEALREEIVRICKAGDEKKQGAFTMATAAHLERLVVAAKDILLAEKIAANDMEGLLNMKRRRMNGGYISASMDSMGDDFGGPLVGVGGSNENFGVQAIRQIVDAAQKMHESPAKLVEALAVAKQHGLTDVVASIEAKLGIVPKAVAAEPVLAVVAEATS